MMNCFIVYFFIFNFGSLGASSDFADENYDMNASLMYMSLDENNTSSDLNHIASESNDISQSSNSGKRKGYPPSDHEKNEKHIDKINKVFNEDSKTVPSTAPSTPPRNPDRKKLSVLDLHTPDVDRINSLTDKQMQTVVRELKSIKDTPEKSKEKIADGFAAKNRSWIIGSETDEVRQNDLLFKGYNNKSHTNDLVARLSHLLSPEQSARLSAVDCNHVMHPVGKHDANGALIGITGGHSLKQYVDKSLLRPFDEVFIASKHLVGANIQGVASKTFDANLSPEIAVQNRKRSKTVAQTPERFKISQISSGGYTGSYVSPYSPLVYTSEFPIITVTDATQGDSIRVGQFGKVSVDGSVVPNQDEEPFNISRADFYDIMEKAATSPKNVIPATSQGTVVCDITQALEEHFSQQLSSAGRKKFPVAIYGIQEAR